MALLVALALLAPISAPSAAADWRLPVDGEVTAPFAFDRGSPYAAGQRRGVEIRARPGAPVRAACGGRVLFAGAVPDRGRAVTVRCARGAWVASHLGLGTTTVRVGRRVRRRTPLGTVGIAGIVRLGARREGERHGYVDPLALVGVPAGMPPPLAPAGRRRTPRGDVPPRSPRPAPAVRPAAGPRDAARAGRVPVVAWVGLALLAAGTPLGVARRRRARRRAAVAREPAPAGR